MPELIDLTGHHFGTWEVKGLAPRPEINTSVWILACLVCNHRREMRSGDLRRRGDKLRCSTCTGKPLRNAQRRPESVALETFWDLVREVLGKDPLYVDKRSPFHVPDDLRFVRFYQECLDNGRRPWTMHG